MNRIYRDRWTEIFGDQDDTLRSVPDEDEFNCLGLPVVAVEEIDWTKTRALSIRQPRVESIMLGENDKE
ncbi:MAG: hypothetical protein ACYC0X_19810 [Pirellulaceae bacterium]